MARYKVLKDMRNRRTGFMAKKGTVIQGRETTKRGKNGVLLMKRKMSFTYQFIPSEMVGTVIVQIPGDLGIGTPKPKPTFGGSEKPIDLGDTPTQGGYVSPSNNTPKRNFDGDEISYFDDELSFDGDGMSYFDDEY